MKLSFVVFNLLLLINTSSAKLPSKEIPNCAQQYHNKLFCLHRLMHNPAQQRIRSQLFNRMAACFQDPLVKEHCKRVIIIQDRCHRLATEMLPSVPLYQRLMSKVQLRVRGCYRSPSSSEPNFASLEIVRSKRDDDLSLERCNGVSTFEKQCRAKVGESWGRIMQSRDDLHRETLRWKACMQIVSRECRYDFPSSVVRRCVLDAMESYFASERGNIFASMIEYCYRQNGTLNGFVEDDKLNSNKGDRSGLVGWGSETETTEETPFGEVTSESTFNWEGGDNSNELDIFSETSESKPITNNQPTGVTRTRSRLNRKSNEDWESNKQNEFTTDGIPQTDDNAAVTPPSTDSLWEFEREATTEVLDGYDFGEDLISEDSGKNVDAIDPFDDANNDDVNDDFDLDGFGDWGDDFRN